jgi:hypothetical protein
VKLEEYFKIDGTKIMNIEDYFDIHGRYQLKNGVYNVFGSVYLIKKVEKLPCKFGKVSNSFYCLNNNLETLEGFPEFVGNFFDCRYNKLTSLKGCPTYIGNDFLCDENLQNNKEYKQYLILKKLRT